MKDLNHIVIETNEDKILPKITVIGKIPENILSINGTPSTLFERPKDRFIRKKSRGHKK